MTNTRQESSLCLVTPWPPQHTGIADYAYDLASGFQREGYQLTVVTEVAEPRPLAGVVFRPPAWLTVESAKTFDGLIYQIGNNSSFHIFQLPLLARIPGVVHLHDMVLHHLMAWILFQEGSVPLYRAALAKWYGPYVVSRAMGMLQIGHCIWDSPAVMEVPFFEEVLQHATGLVTNSNFASDKVANTFPSIPRVALPQLYRDVVKHTGAGQADFHIGVLGGIDPNKRIHLLWDVISTLFDAGVPIRLHLAGNVSPSCRDLIERMKTSPYADRVHIHGRVSDAGLLQILSELDLCVALRYPSMGETSAIVMRALQAATPTVVNDIAWYAELPDFVPKVTPGQSDEALQLERLLTTLASRGEEYARLQEATRLWADNRLDFDDTVRQYAQFCMTAGIHG